MLRAIYYFILNNKYALVVIRTIYTFLSRTLEYFITKDNKLVIFGCKNGLWYGDNSKLLFEYLISHPQKIK